MSKRAAFSLVFACLLVAVAFTQSGAGQASKTEPRFIDNGNGTITDSVTGLMWEQAPAGTLMNWEGANSHADGLSLAGYTDWRLPYRIELRDLVRDVEREDHASWLNSVGFKSILPGDYWSGSYFHFSGDDYGWIVNFRFGSTRSMTQQNENHVWLVRGGQ